jgi:hypothetical protein
MTSHVMERKGMTSHFMERQGMPWYGKDGMERHDMTWLGKETHDMKFHCRA